MKLKFIACTVGLTLFTFSCQKTEITPKSENNQGQINSKSLTIGTSLNIVAANGTYADDQTSSVTITVTGFTSRSPKTLNTRITGQYKSCIYMKRADYCGTGDSYTTQGTNYLMTFQSGDLAAGQTYSVEVQDPVSGAYTPSFSFTMPG